MLTFFLILVIVVAVVLGFLVLVQNPKGGGLAGSLGGFGNQFMGVKQTTDVLEKGTWVFAAAMGLLCLFSPFFLPKAGGLLRDAPTNNPVKQAPQSTPTTPPVDTNKTGG